MLPPAITSELVRLGHNAVSVSDLGMRGAADGDIFELAVAQKRVVVTENFADFAALVAQHHKADEPCTTVVFVRKASFADGAVLATTLAEHLNQWATANPDPYRGVHWP